MSTHYPSAADEFAGFLTAEDLAGLQQQQTAEASAEGSGEMIYTDEDIVRRLTSSTGIREEIVAHYQHSISHARTELYERVQEVYYVENIDKGNGYEVVLSVTEDGTERTATCECIGFVDHGSLCKHIVRAVQMGRRRITKRHSRGDITLAATAAIKAEAA